MADWTLIIGTDRRDLRDPQALGELMQILKDDYPDISMSKIADSKDLAKVEIPKVSRWQTQQ